MREGPLTAGQAKDRRRRLPARSDESSKSSRRQAREYRQALPLSISALPVLVNYSHGFRAKTNNDGDVQSISVFPVPHVAGGFAPRTR